MAEKTKEEHKMFEITIKQLLEAGVHFGHPTKKWNPKMAEYIFTQRNGIHIVDLQKTVKKFEEAYNFVAELAQENGTILFVGTKKQAAETVKEENGAVLLCELSYEVVSLLELLNGLLKVYDVNTVSLSEDVLCHLGVPLLGRVTEVNACLKQLLDSNFEHFMFLLGFFRHSDITLRLVRAPATNPLAM